MSMGGLLCIVVYNMDCNTYRQLLYLCTFMLCTLIHFSEKGSVGVIRFSKGCMTQKEKFKNPWVNGM